ncbi:hypothetical protein V6B33_11270 [Mangrovibacillus sp. Mu-81]
MKKLIKTIVITAVILTGATGASAADISPQYVESDPGGGGTGGK